MEGEDEEVVMVAGVVFEQACTHVCACTCVCVCLSVRSRCSQSVRENGRLNLRSADWPIRDCFLVTHGSQFTLPFSLAVRLFLFTLSLKCFRHYCCPVCLFLSIFPFFFFSLVRSFFLVFPRWTLNSIPVLGPAASFTPCCLLSSHLDIVPIIPVCHLPICHCSQERNKDVNRPSSACSSICPAPSSKQNIGLFDHIKKWLFFPLIFTNKQNPPSSTSFCKLRSAKQKSRGDFCLLQRFMNHRSSLVRFIYHSCHFWNIKSDLDSRLNSKELSSLTFLLSE